MSLFNEKYENLVLNLNDAQNKYFKRFKRVPDKLFLTIEHWNILSDGMLESECHKTSFSNIAIEITKCSKSSYFSSNGAGLVVTVKTQVVYSDGELLLYANGSLMDSVESSDVSVKI